MLESEFERRVGILLLFLEAAAKAQPRRARRLYPLFFRRDAWRRTITGQRRCRFCGTWITRCAKVGPLPDYCSGRCAKRPYDFNPRKKAARAAWMRKWRAARKGQSVNDGH